MFPLILQHIFNWNLLFIFLIYRALSYLSSLRMIFSTSNYFYFFTDTNVRFDFLSRWKFFLFDQKGKKYCDRFFFSPMLFIFCFDFNNNSANHTGKNRAGGFFVWFSLKIVVKPARPKGVKRVYEFEATDSTSVDFITKY